MDETPVPVFPLLQLPRELREYIYAFALDEPVRYARRHSPLCEFSERNTLVPETPPFQIDHESASSSSSCRCARRRNTGLLLANRQIHDEATPLFWRQGVFSFKSPADLVRTICADGTGRIGASIHYMRIDYPCGRSRLADICCMRDALGACKNLRRLEMNVVILTYLGNAFNFSRNNPHLETFRCFYIAEQRQVYDSSYSTGGNRLYFEYGATIPVHSVDSLRQDGMFYTYLSAMSSTTFDVFFRLAKRCRYLVFMRQRCPKDYPRLNPGVDERYRRQKVTRRYAGYEAETFVTVYGLPNSHAMLEEHKKERQKRMRRWKTEGFPSVKETTTPPAAVQVREAKKEIDKRLWEQQQKFELAMKEKGITIRKFKPDPEPEEPWKKRRRAKLTKKWGTRMRGAERLMKSSELLSLQENG